MALTFAPLGWIYHDGWNWKQSKLLEDGDRVVDASREHFQRGHVHLFLPGRDSFAARGVVASTKAYWGEQTYSFQYQEDWGPNSADPSHDNTLTLVGSPVWHFRVEEYWRRFYVQPYDQEDPSVDLPLNRAVRWRTVDRRRFMKGLIDEWCLENEYSFETWLESRRLQTAMEEYIGYCERRDGKKPEFDEDDGPADWIDADESRQADFRRFYAAGRSGLPWISEEAGMEEFLEKFVRKPISSFPHDPDGNVLVREEDSGGRAGIRYDVSSPAHSLGPFREGGEFFFWNSVVNRALPCEYWLDERRRVREHLLRRKSDLHPDTAGGQTWSSGDDYSRWTWVHNLFEECSGRPDWRSDEYHQGFTTYLPCLVEPGILGLSSSDRYIYGVQPANAKRLKDDQSEYRSGRWYGDNSAIPMDPYYDYRRSSSSAGVAVSLALNDALEEAGFSGDPWKAPEESSGTPWTDYGPSSAAAAQSSSDARPSPDWMSGRRWDGWYENGEIVHAADGGWYRRVWRPVGYQDASYGDDDGRTQPCWTRRKRQCLPCPPPWLCAMGLESPHPAAVDDGSGVYTPKSAGGPDDPPESARWHFATDPDPWGDALAEGGLEDSGPDARDDARRHLLDWEYCRYYGLVRTHAANGGYSRRRIYFYWLSWRSDDGSEGRIEAPVRGSCPELWHGSPVAVPESWGLSDRDVSDGSGKQVQDLMDAGVKALLPAGASFTACEASEDRLPIALDWETALEDWSSRSNNGSMPASWSEERAVLGEWLAGLAAFVDPSGRRPFDFAGLYGDRLVMLDSDGRAIDPSRIRSDGKYLPSWIIPSMGYEPSEEDWMDPAGSVLVACYRRRGEASMTALESWPLQAPEDSDMDYPSYATIEEFGTIWERLSDEEVSRMGLSGDMPVRNSRPWFEDESDLERIWPTDPDAIRLEIPGSSNEWIAAVAAYRRSLHEKCLSLRFAESCPSRMLSAFEPRIDDLTRAENRRRARQNPPQPAYPLSPGDWDVREAKGDASRDYGFDPFSPWLPKEDASPDDEPESPDENWRRFFDRREEWTIPNSTTVPGDRTVVNTVGSPNWPNPHPRETAYGPEDGARRLIPDYEYITPVIEYQRVLRVNGTDRGDGYCRLPGREQEQSWIDANWRTCRKDASFGDGFSVTVKIPWTVNGEIQSPFSGSDGVTAPPGKYFHSCVREEDKMRYHVEWYDSLDQIRKWDFPSWVRLMHEFQSEQVTEEALDEYRDQHDGADPEKPYLLSVYRIDYDNPEREGWGTGAYSDRSIHDRTWPEELDDFWRRMDAQYGFSNRPVTRDRDAFGEKMKPDSFVKEQHSGKWLWRGHATEALVSDDQVPEAGEDGRRGYVDSSGNFVKGGKVVEFNDPFPERSDGRWIEQCLGAVVKARVTLVFEDRLGHRFTRVVDSTAMTPDSPITGSDIDG